MKTTMGMEKAKGWLSETVGTKIATRLFRGLALGVLLVSATGIYFSINQGDQSEAGSPLASEQGACYPLYPELGPCASEFVAVTPTSTDRNDRGLFDEVLPEDLISGNVPTVDRYGRSLFDQVLPEDLISGLPVAGVSQEPSTVRPLTREQEVLPEDLISGFAAAEVSQEPSTVRPLTREQLQLIQDYEMVGIPWRVDADGNVVELPWQEFASSRLSSEQSQCYPEDVVLGWCYGFADAPDPAFTTGTSVSGIQFEEWPEVGFDSVTYQRFMVEQGKVGKGLSPAKVYAEIDDVEAMVIYGYPASIFHALNQGKVARAPSINGIRCYSEDNC